MNLTSRKHIVVLVLDLIKQKPHKESLIQKRFWAAAYKFFWGALLFKRLHYNTTQPDIVPLEQRKYLSNRRKYLISNIAESFSKRRVTLQREGPIKHLTLFIS